MINRKITLLATLGLGLFSCSQTHAQVTAGWIPDSAKPGFNLFLHDPANSKLHAAALAVMWTYVAYYLNSKGAPTMDDVVKKTIGKKAKTKETEKYYKDLGAKVGYVFLLISGTYLINDLILNNVIPKTK